jgi:F0F1-type ATP synthase assembly protein I
MKLSMVNDNKLVDLIAAILTGVGLCWLDLSNRFLIPLTFKDILQSASIRIGALVFVALMLFLWKHKLRTQWGWIVIAILGLTLIAGIDEMILRARDREPDAFDVFSPFPLEIVIYIVPAVIFMGAAHYVGLLIMPQKRRYA